MQALSEFLVTARARIGFFLQNVAQAATSSFAGDSTLRSREAPVPMRASVSSVKIDEPLRPSGPPPEIRLAVLPRKQLDDIEKSFGALLKQLPSKLDVKLKLSQTNHRITRINQP